MKHFRTLPVLRGNPPIRGLHAAAAAAAANVSPQLVPDYYQGACVCTDVFENMFQHVAVASDHIAWSTCGQTIVTHSDSVQTWCCSVAAKCNAVACKSHRLRSCTHTGVHMSIHMIHFSFVQLLPHQHA